MKKQNNEMQSGVIVFLLIGSFFLLMELLRLSDNVFLRSINIVFVAYGVVRVISKNYEKDNTDYLENLISGVQTSIIGVALSIVGLWFYLTFFTLPQYINELAVPVFMLGGNMSPLQFCLSLLIEGLASSFILSFVIMQYFKKESVVRLA